MSRIALLWRQHRIAFLAFLVAAAVTLFFAVRFAVFAIYWADPEHRNQHPEGWMTPSYIARSWKVPRDELVRALELTPTPGHPQTLSDIARSRGQPLDDLIDEVEMLLTLLQAGSGQK